MPGVRHDTLVLALKDNPALLAELLRRVCGARVPGALTAADSVVRFTASLETRPDLLFTVQAPGSPWVLVEVQNRPDETKARSWHLAASVLLQRHGMGDLVVITASRAVARWAAAVVRHRGELGTEMGIRPVVIHLTREQIAALLDPAAPQLAQIAVWAGCRGRGPEAKQIAWRALEVTATLPVELREAQKRAIFAMLDQRLLDALKEKAMDVNKIPLTKAHREFLQWLDEFSREVGEAQGLAKGEAQGLAKGEAQGLAKGKAEGLTEGRRSALLALLSARGLTPSVQERERIEAAGDADALLECVQCAATATTVADALAPLRDRRKPAPRPRRARSTGGSKAGRPHR